KKKWEDASGDFKFAASVAGFGMLLRDSKYKGNASWGLVRNLARQGQGDDRNGYRGEFLGMIDAAERLSGGKKEPTSFGACEERRRARTCGGLRFRATCRLRTSLLRVGRRGGQVFHERGILQSLEAVGDDGGGDLRPRLGGVGVVGPEVGAAHL